jgi:protein TonB
MKTTLFESGAKRKRPKGGLAASIVIHGVLIGAALTAGTQVAASTLEKPKAEKIEYVRPPEPKPEPEKIYVAPKKAPKAAPKVAERKAPPPPRPRAPEPPRQVAAAPAPAPKINLPANVPVITTPTTVPTSLPAIDPKALETTSEIVARASDVAASAASDKGSGSGRVTEESTGDVGVSRGDGSAWSEDQVDREVAALGGEGPRYPESLRASGVTGTVIMRFVVGPNGRVEMGTVKVVDSPNDQFTDAVKTALRRMRFRPAEVRGTKVRQLVEQSFTFKLG